MTKTTTITATLIVALSAALISGCTPTGPSVVAPTAPAPTVSSTTEPTAEPTEAPEAPAEAEIVVGGTVDADTAREINRDFKSTTKAYPLSDGSYMVIDREQPLPEPVKAEVEAKVQAKKEAVAADTQYPGLAESINTHQQETGRKVILVIEVNIYCQNNGDYRTMQWSTLTTKGWNTCLGSRDAAIAAAQQHIAEQDSPADWEIIFG